jgi:hypothetical protein
MTADSTGAEATGADTKRPGETLPDEDSLELGQDLEAPTSQQAEAAGETGRLAFGDEEVRLPWLEADEDEDDYQGYNAGQVLALLILGLVAMAVIGGGLWWAIHHRKDEVQVANGGVIAAPQQPYKERPKNPGGKTFEGTGDTSFAVSEGQTRPARLGESPAARPSAEASSKASAAAAGEDAGGVGVQVAAYSTRAQAEAGWTKLSAQYEPLAGLHHRVVEGQADIGTVYRLQAVAADSGAAHSLCGKLKGAGLACQVKN